MRTILVINAGSSSIKFEQFGLADGDGLERRLEGQIDGIGVKPRLRAKDARGAVLVDRSMSASEVPDSTAAQAVVGAWLTEVGQGELAAVGHRVVHGGATQGGPVAIDDAVLARLALLIPLAPLHQPNNLAPIRAIRARRPDLLQVACFDTAFHRGHAEVVDRFAIPRSLHREGVRRYGFHGLSYEYIASRLPELAPKLAKGRVVVAHLGSGASLCGIVNGRSVESTMGFTALEGLPMGTRPGQLDAGVVLYLMAEKGWDPKSVEHFLYHECGLKGLSGVSNDVRELLASDRPEAKLALDYFAHKIAQLTAGIVVTMGGLDGLVFTAGIGENAPVIREAVAHRLRFLGVRLDPARNAAGDTGSIAAAESPVEVLVIPTDEELMIARHTLAVLRSRA